MAASDLVFDARRARVSCAPAAELDAAAYFWMARYRTQVKHGRQMAALVKSPAALKLDSPAEFEPKTLKSRQYALARKYASGTYRSRNRSDSA